MNRWWCLAGLALAGVAAADDAALRVVDACRARLDPRTDVGMARIAKRCPELMSALATAPWRDLLPHSMVERREEISAESLRALAELVRHANDAAPPRVAPQRDSLVPVLAELGDKGRQGATRWERFKRWLKHKLASRKDGELGWLDEWSRQFHTSEGVARAITYVGYVLVGVLVLFVIWTELRAAGLLGGRPRNAARSGPAAEWRRRLLLADVLAAPLPDRPGMLLRLLGEALTRAHRLPAADGLTAAAIARRADLESGADRDELGRVAIAADEVRYAGRALPDAELEATVTTARSLLAKFARLTSVRR